MNKRAFVFLLTMVLVFLSLGVGANSINNSSETEKYLVNESFNNFATGRTPSGWIVTEKGGSITVRDVPSSTDKSMKLNDTSVASNCTAKKTFAAQKGIITLEAAIMLTSKTDFFSINLMGGTKEAIRVETSGDYLCYRDSEGTYATLQVYKINTWYKIKIIADIEKNKCGVSINGLNKAKQVAFKNAVSSLDNIVAATPGSKKGIMYVDNAAVYTGGAVPSPTPAPPADGLVITASADSSLIPRVEDTNVMACYLQGDEGGATSFRFVDARPTDVNDYPKNSVTVFRNRKQYGDTYLQKDRDVGQTFKAEKNFELDAVYLRVGPNTPKANASGARVALQIFEVCGEPVLNDHGTPGFKGVFDRKNSPELDDYLTGEFYKSLITATGYLPSKINKSDYLKWDITGNKEITLEAGKNYAFILMFVDRISDQALSLYNNYYGSYKPDPKNQWVGHGIRREGNPAFPGSFKERTNIKPGTLGFPDVDTYRDYYFMVTAVPGSAG